jgi:hypothetical protein
MNEYDAVVLGMTDSLTFLVWEFSTGTYELKLEGVKLHDEQAGFRFLRSLINLAETVRPTSDDLWVCNQDGRWMSIKYLLVEFDHADEC